MIVIAVFLVLSTGWILWGWIIGEARDIRWMRHWCGTCFVILVATLSAGAGTMLARTMDRGALRESVLQVLQEIADRIEAGEPSRVVNEIRRLDHRDDSDAHDLLDELPKFLMRLRMDLPETRTATADYPRREPY